MEIAHAPVFCPKCKLEYREGFTECSDCQVPLVRSLDAVPTTISEYENPETVELLWTGTDDSAVGAIISALKAAKISYHTTSREVGPLPGLSTRVYAILIHVRDRAIAHTALDDARQKLELPPQDEDEEPTDTDVTLPLDSPWHQEDEADSPTLPATKYVPDDFDPEDATSEVWSGPDAILAQGLKDSLRENGIGCALTKIEAGRRIAVLPADEPRAREIIREVVEATPPE